MIRVNLLGKDTTKDTSTGLLLVGYVVILVISLLAFFAAYMSVSSKVSSLKQDVVRLEGELNKVRETTKEVRDLEKKRKELNDKLLVIALLKKSKAGPVHVMDDLNMALPTRAWLVSMSEKSTLLQIDGKALDNQTIASFMDDLTKSEYFRNVDLVQSKQSLFNNVKIKDFTLQAKISYTGKHNLPSDQSQEEGKNGKGAKKTTSKK